MPSSGDGHSSQDRSVESSGQASRSSSRPPKKSARIHWQSHGESMDSRKQRSTFNVRDHSASPPKKEPREETRKENIKPLPRTRRNSIHSRVGSASSSAQRSPPLFSEEVDKALSKTSAKPSILRHLSRSSRGSQNNEDEGEDRENDVSMGKAVAQRTAQTRAQRLSRDLGIKSAPGSKLNSPASSPPPSPPPEEQYKTPIDFESIPLERLETKRRRYGIEDETESEGSDDEETHKKKNNRFYEAAKRLVKRHTAKDERTLFRVPAMSSQTSLPSGQLTPDIEKDPNHYVPRPKQYHEGILSSIMRLYDGQRPGATPSKHPLEHTRSTRHVASKESLLGSIISPPSSGRVTPDLKKKSGQTTPKHQKWYYKDPSPSSTPSIANLVSSSRILAQPTGAPLTQAEESAPSVQGKKAGMRPASRPKPTTAGSNQAFTTFMNKVTGAGSDDEIKIHLHIADVLKRHQYLLKLCKALMSYGAPTHRLEGKHRNPFSTGSLLILDRVHANVSQSSRGRRTIPLHPWLHDHLLRR